MHVNSRLMFFSILSVHLWPHPSSFSSSDPLSILCFTNANVVQSFVTRVLIPFFSIALSDRISCDHSIASLWQVLANLKKKWNQTLLSYGLVSDGRLSYAATSVSVSVNKLLRTHSHFHRLWSLDDDDNQPLSWVLRVIAHFRRRIYY